MPSIPEYNQGATEEAGLTRAKRRVITNMQSGIVKLTERPDEDLTGGDADVIARSLIAQFEDLTALFRQITAYFGSGETGQIFLDQASDIIKAFGVVIGSSKLIARILRTAKALVSVMRYMDLGILSDLKAVQGECGESATEAFSALRLIDFDDEVNLRQAESEMGDQMDELYGSEPSYDPNEPDFDTVGDYSIQSDPTGGPASRATTAPSMATVRRGRPVVPGSKTDLLQQANKALRDLQRTQLDKQLREEGRRLLMEGVERDKANEVPKEELDDVSILTDDQPQGKVKLFKKLNKLAFETLRIKMGQSLSDTFDILEKGYANFNKHRKQRVRRLNKNVDVAEEVKTASGRMPRVMYRGQMYTRDYHPGDRMATEAEMRGGNIEELAQAGEIDFNRIQGSNSRMGGRVYKIGGSTDLLYERSGLPRFL